jgi:predicted small metal-binding protein
MVKYARCNNFTSLALNKDGQACRYMSKADTEQEVLDDMSHHVQEAHGVDPEALLKTIQACIYETGTKVFGTRAPDADPRHPHH